MKRVCLVGGGNITNLRHIPALKRHRNRIKIVGVVGADRSAVERTAKRVGVSQMAIIQSPELSLEHIPWLDKIDLAVIGTPPRSHAGLVQAALRRGLNVLVEKPVTVEPSDTEALIKLAREARRTFAVMHNFQFANGALHLKRLMDDGSLGDIVSFFMFQFTSRQRRLPSWYKDLPLGLFFDEASHFFYLLRRLGGPIRVIDAQGQFSPDLEDRTPVLMNATLMAGDTPAQMSINFNAPVCEWMFVVSGSKKLACYDFFRDVLVVLPNDGQHYAMDVLRTSALSTLGHWSGFVANGTRLLTGNLHYGVDVVVGHVLDAIDGKPLPAEISGERGLETVAAMARICSLIESRKPHGIAA